MLRKLLLANFIYLYQFKYWIVLLSLLVIGYSYQQVDKSSEYLSGVEFVYYEDVSLFTLEVGDLIFYKGRLKRLSEKKLEKFFTLFQKGKSAKFIRLAISENCIYHFLLSSEAINGKTKIIGNHLLSLLEKDNLVKLTSTNISDISREEKETLHALCVVLKKTIQLKKSDEFGNFILTAKSKNRAFVNFLPLHYYRHLIHYMEFAGNEKLLREYNMLKTKNENIERVFALKEKQLLALEDQHRTLKYSSDLVDLQIFEAETDILEVELSKSQDYYYDIAQKIDLKVSQFYLVNQLIIPIEYKTNWSRKFLSLSFIGLLICYIVIFMTFLLKSIDINTLLIDVN